MSARTDLLAALADEPRLRVSAFHPDHAALRRYLVDEAFLAREAGTYWRIGGSVDVSES